ERGYQSQSCYRSPDEPVVRPAKHDDHESRRHHKAVEGRSQERREPQRCRIKPRELHLPGGEFEKFAERAVFDRWGQRLRDKPDVEARFLYDPRTDEIVGQCTFETFGNSEPFPQAASDRHRTGPAKAALWPECRSDGSI